MDGKKDGAPLIAPLMAIWRPNDIEKHWPLRRDGMVTTKPLCELSKEGYR